MEQLVSEELKDVLKGVKCISGTVEKLVRGRWTDRWLTISIGTASIHYYLSKDDQNNNKVRGIYPLTGARVETAIKEEENHHAFAVFLAAQKKIRFRTKTKDETRTWIMIINHLAIQIPEKQREPVEGTLTVKSGISWSKRVATLDEDLKTITLGKTVRHSEGSNPAEEFSLEGGSVRSVKSYGKTFEFELSAMSCSNKSVELRLRAPSEGDRFMWCQAIQGVIDNRVAFQLSPGKGQEEGVISVREIMEHKPGGSDETQVVLKGLQGFSPKIMSRIGYYLQEHPIIHTGDISKVYHTDLKRVTGALMDAGFVAGVQDSTPELVFELRAKPPVELEDTPTIEDVVNVLRPIYCSSMTSSSPL